MIENEGRRRMRTVIFRLQASMIRTMKKPPQDGPQSPRMLLDNHALSEVPRMHPNLVVVTRTMRLLLPRFNPQRKMGEDRNAPGTRRITILDWRNVNEAARNRWPMNSAEELTTSIKVECVRIVLPGSQWYFLAACRTESTTPRLAEAPLLLQSYSFLPSFVSQPLRRAERIITNNRRWRGLQALNRQNRLRGRMLRTQRDDPCKSIFMEPFDADDGQWHRHVAVSYFRAHTWSQQSVTAMNLLYVGEQTLFIWRYFLRGAWLNLLRAQTRIVLWTIDIVN